MVGVLTKVGKESSISGSLILLQVVATRKMASHHFGLDSNVKDLNAKQMLENMYNTKFFWIKTCDGDWSIQQHGNISFEDPKFLGLMDQKSRKIGGVYKIPLPLNCRLVKLPNNRNLAEKRLHCLKSRSIETQNFLQITVGSWKIFWLMDMQRNQQKNHLIDGHGTFSIMGSVILTTLKN